MENLNNDSLGTMKPSPFLFECFDSKNTSITKEIPLAQSLAVAREIARRLSLQYHHVTLHSKAQWETYSNSQKVQWSYPLGIEK